MIGDTFQVNNKQYVIKRNITMGEYRKINQINSKLSKISDKISGDISKMSPDELRILGNQFANVNDEQLDIIVGFVSSILEISQDDIDKMDLTECMAVFQEAFRISTTPDKDLKKT